MEKPSVAEILRAMGKAYLVQKAHDSVRPLVQEAVRRHPGLRPETIEKQLVVEVAAALPGVIRSYFPGSEKLNYFAGILIREILQELKVTAEDHESTGGAYGRVPGVAGAQGAGRHNRLLGFIGRVRAGDVDGLGAHDVVRFLGFMRSLSEDELDRIKRVGDDDELIGLVSSRSFEELRNAILLTKGQDLLTVAERQVGARTKKLAAGVVDAWNRMGKWAEEDAARARTRTKALKERRAIEREEKQRALALSPPPPKKMLSARLWSLFKGGDF
jgi:hypothetical protein